MICAKASLNLLLSNCGFRFESRAWLASKMVAPRIIAAELLKKRMEKAKSKSTMLNTAELHVIGSNCQSFQPSLLVTSEGCSYLFNCNEGFQRLSYANKIKLLNLENAFITNNDWKNVSGAFGLSLTLQDIGCPSFTLRGADGVDGFFDATRTFMTFNSGITTGTLSHLVGEFEDSGLKVTPIPIDYHTTSNHDVDDVGQKRSKTETKLISYVCLMPDLPGRLDAQKCRELKVPIGPKLAILKNGQDVTLSDGRLIKSIDVCGPKNQGLYFIVIECPTVDHIDSVTRNDQLNELRNKRKPSEERQIDLVVHFSPEDVIEHAKYQEWMNGFPSNCKHWLMVHSESNFINFLDSYRYMYLYRQLDNEIFPELYLPEFATKAIEKELAETQQVETKFSSLEIEMDSVPVKKANVHDMDRVTKANAFDKIMIRPTGIVETMQRKYAIDGYYRMAKLHPSFDAKFKRHQERLKNMPTPNVFEPQLIFLGTGSAIPSKLRNTSCILLNFDVPKEISVMLDCGEDSYGQLIRYYGPERAKEVLGRLKMVYVSHHHADHHIGLIRLIKERCKVTDEPVILLLPPGVETLLKFHDMNYEDLSKFYRVYSTRMLKVSSMTHELESAGKALKYDLAKELNGFIDDFTIVGVDHCVNSCAVVFSFKISRPGMNKFRLAYSGDARPSEDFIRVAHGCDLLIHEATFDHRGTMDALNKKHSTTNEAIDVGRRMGAQFTILTHFSQRFAKIPYFTEEFDDKVGFAFDNLTLKCPSHFARLPILKDILKTIHDGTLQDIDAKHLKKEMRSKIIDKRFDNVASCQ